MSDLATVIAQLSGNQQPAADPAMAAVKLARASIDALVLKLGQTIDAKVVGQLAAGLTQLSAGDESFVLKLETPLPAGTAVTIKVAATPQGMPAVRVSVPAATPHAAPLPIPVTTTHLMPQPQVKQPVPPPPTVRALPQASQLPLAAPAALPSVAPPPAQPVPPPVPLSPQPTIAAPAQVLASGSQPVPVATASAALPAPAAAVPATHSPMTAPVPTSPAPPALATPGQPAAQVPQPILLQPVATVPQPAIIPVVQSVAQGAQPAVTPLPAAPVALTAAPGAPAGTAQVVLPAQSAPPAALPALPAAPLIAAASPPQILSAPLTAQPLQPLPSHPSPYPVHVPQAATPVVAQQLQLPTTPAAAMPRSVASLLNLADPAQAAARQDSAAPLLARLATLVTAVASPLPRPVIEMAQKVLASRMDLNRGAPDGKTLEAAVLKAGVLLTPLAREAPTDAKSALLALRSTLLAFLGADHATPVASTERPAPPIKGDPARAPMAQAAIPDPAVDGHETARALLGHTDAALSRLKLLQTASQPPDARIDAPAPRNELRVEIPMTLGAETGILQLMVERDGKQKREPERQRGWRMRFAMNFSQTGEVGADIALLGRSASIAIWAADPNTADALDEMLPELAPAIQRHGLELTSLRVRRGAPQPTRPAPGQLLDSAR